MLTFPNYHDAKVKSMHALTTEQEGTNRGQGFQQKNADKRGF
jgi:hypothetical protein